MAVVLQTETSECGLAALCNAAGLLGKHVAIDELRRTFSIGAHGLSLRQLIVIARHLGLAGRPLKLELSHLGNLRMPAILHWDLNHFVVLKKVGWRKAVVIDPAIGERKLSFDEISQHFTGVALELTPGADFSIQAPVPRVGLKLLIGRVTGLKRSMLQIGFVALALELFAIAAPMFQQLVVDEVLIASDRSLLAVLALGFGLLLIIQTLVGLVRSWMVILLGQTLYLQWTGNVFAHLVRLPVS